MRRISSNAKGFSLDPSEGARDNLTAKSMAEGISLPFPFRLDDNGDDTPGSVLGVTGDARVYDDDEATLETDEKDRFGTSGEVGVVGELQSDNGTTGPGVAR